MISAFSPAIVSSPVVNPPIRTTSAAAE